MTHLLPMHTKTDGSGTSRLNGTNHSSEGGSSSNSCTHPFLLGVGATRSVRYFLYGCLLFSTFLFGIQVGIHWNEIFGTYQQLKLVSAHTFQMSQFRQTFEAVFIDSSAPTQSMMSMSSALPFLLPPISPLFPLRLHVVTAINAKDSDGLFCHFLASALWNDIPVTVLGWEDANQFNSADGHQFPTPKTLKQLYTREFYLGSKVTLLLKYLTTQNFTENDLVLFTDSSDVLFQRTRLDIEELLYTSMAASNYSSIVVSGEHDIWPPSFEPAYQEYQQTPRYRFNLERFRPPPTNTTETPYYHGLNSGSFVGRASLLIPLLQELERDRVDYLEHHLIYSDIGELIAGGEQTIQIPGPLLHPDTLQPVDNYIVPGVYKRNDQITFSMLYYQQSQATNYGLVIDETATLFQTMQLTVDDVLTRLLRDNVTYPLQTQLRYLDWWQPQAYDAHGQIVSSVIDAATSSDQRLVHRDTHLLPMMVHYNGPSKLQSENEFHELAYASLMNATFYTQPNFLRVALPLIDQRRLRRHLLSDHFLRFFRRDMARLTINVIEICPNLIPHT